MYTLQHKNTGRFFFLKKDALGIILFLIPEAYETVLTDLDKITWNSIEDF